MEHRLVTSIEVALGWSDAGPLGTEFARGTIDDPALTERTLTPNRLLDLVMRRSLSNPQFRCFQNGDELHPNAYLTDEVTLRGQSVRMANTHRLGDLLRQGATVVLDQVNTFDPTMEATCRALQWWSRERVQVNAYLTTNDASGFRLHWDDHDVLIVQLAGEKQWEVRGPSRTAPLYRDADRNDEPSEDVVWAGTMRTGDVMHIPRGCWHQATRNGSGSGKSLHMTFGFAKRTGVSWLSWLADWSREQEIFRHDLDRTGGTDVETLAAAAAELVQQRGPADFLAAREQEAPVPRHVPFLDILGPIEGVACITHFPPQVTDRGDTIEVTAAGRKLTFRAKALPALRLLLSGHPVHLAEAAAQVGADVEQVAEILVQEELCAVLTPELSSGYTGLVTNAAP
jgi:hypothetical protein